ncbi:MAG TPA: DUF4234 domain-containing protein [Planctomycetota bacterium]|nr:DUF4234 domain-containing protein [Planctomycetota bacterium]
MDEKRKPCPMCAEAVPADAKVCPWCKSVLERRCPACAETIPADATVCRFCRSAVAAGEVPVRPRAAVAGPTGEERDVLTLVLLTLVTCGIYGLVVSYRIGEELNAHRGRADLRPGLDIVLSIVSCGLWGIYVMYCYPRALEDVVRDEGGTPPQIMLPCLLLSIFGLHIVALAIFQHELNAHWKTHRPESRS